MLICSIIIVIIISIINIGGCKLSIAKYLMLLVFFFSW